MNLTTNMSPANLMLGFIALFLIAPQNQEKRDKKRTLNDNNELVLHQFSGSEVADISINEDVYFPFG